MSAGRSILTLDANIFVASLKGDEPHRKECLRLLSRVPDSFFLAEPSIIYQEVCGTLSKRVGLKEAKLASALLDKLIPESLLLDCNKQYCLSSFSLCSDYGIYSIDALYMHAAIRSGASLISLDKEDFIDKLRENKHNIKVHHVSDFPL